MHRSVTRQVPVAVRAKQQLAASSIRRKLSALSALFDYLGEHNAVTGNPVDGVKRPEYPKARYRPFSKNYRNPSFPGFLEQLFAGCCRHPIILSLHTDITCQPLKMSKSAPKHQTEQHDEH
jgi:hypothetical protein